MALTQPLRTNADRLMTTRVVGVIVPPNVPGPLLDPSGMQRFRPGQGSVALNVRIGDRALGWASDHLEPGASLAHPHPDANRALQILSCVGNTGLVATGPGRGKRGVVIGKHGTTLVDFSAGTHALLAPGDSVCIDAYGVGLELLDFPEIRLHSCSPQVLEAFARSREGRLMLRVVSILPAEVAAAGLGMEAAWANIDLETHDDQLREKAHLDELRFGDLVLLEGQDHRHVRRHDPEWITVGSITHGASVSGGHGLGMVTLLTAPRSLVDLDLDATANLGAILHFPSEERSK